MLRGGRNKAKSKVTFSLRNKKEARHLGKSMDADRKNHVEYKTNETRKPPGTELP